MPSAPTRGYVYIRQEYPLALENLSLAIEDAEKRGLLGKDILGSGFDFQVKAHRGAGAFVCGEETALIISLEGEVGEPTPETALPCRPRALGQADDHQQCGDMGQHPSDYQQGELLPLPRSAPREARARRSSPWSARSPIPASWKCPMGISLRDVIYKIGGGIPDGKKFKAVQTGGPSGGCIPGGTAGSGSRF